MPDRSLRLLTFPQPSAQGGGRGAVLLREHPSSPPEPPRGEGSGGDRRRGSEENNPFAPPPEGTPDQPWQPRRPPGDEGGDSGGEGDGGRPLWGGRWSDRQPGRSSGGFGERPRGPEGQGGGGAGAPRSPGPRWDPTDPAQRRARYSLLSGMWAFFFALFGWPYVGLLLGALAVHWAVSALRAKPRAASDPDSPAPPAQKGRPQTTAAVSGLVTASLALILVAVSFTAQMVYQDYYTCTNDALTQQSKESCNDLLPDELQKLLGTAE
ncbi:MFS transporter [Streptomyces sp. KMM 9044]|uniref:MFS transporter n=1 Tax=Streptomyces sp. KMM 9044 TaxID=2744474 RepID=UPI002150F8D7|nr:MFS transporter [Streptomyces sp. KMM 9044]WAX78383.1 MFS transporter [Streptomyces sp. KMM 9044]